VVWPLVVVVFVVGILVVGKVKFVVPTFVVWFPPPPTPDGTVSIAPNSQFHVEPSQLHKVLP
jgi:hypothetical protein